MRTTLDLPESLLLEAQQVLGFKSKTDTIIQSLRELVRRDRNDQLRASLGTIKLDIDIPKSRRRPKA